MQRHDITACFEGKNLKCRIKGAALILLSGFVLSLSGCGPKVIPLPADGAVIDEKRGEITLEKDGIKITAKAAFPGRTSYAIERYFTPFFVSIRNKSGGDIKVTHESFMLFDERGNQYNAFTPEEIAKIARSDPAYAGQPPIVILPPPVYENYSGIHPPYPYLYDYRRYPYDEPYFDPVLRQWIYPAYIWPGERRDISGETFLQDIFLNALPSGKVVNSARIFGNIYLKINMRKVRIPVKASTHSGLVFLTVTGYQWRDNVSYTKNLTGPDHALVLMFFLCVGYLYIQASPYIITDLMPISYLSDLFCIICVKS